MKHLLLVSIGPVQEFIAQARRTRDLWFGSHLLSEVSRAAARAISERSGSLMLPTLPRDDPELLPCDAPLRPMGNPPLNVPNKILAELADDVDPASVARAAREAATARWRDFASAVRTNTAQLLAPQIAQVWQEQIDSFLEFQAAWSPLEAEDHVSARREVETLLAGRKNLREFGAWTQRRGGVPKSSLDGARETVLREPNLRNPALVRRYRINPSEQLDAVGLVKRAGGTPEQFAPLANIAFAAWLNLAGLEAEGALEELRTACSTHGWPRIDRRDLPWVNAFPFDAQLLMESRWPSLRAELGSNPEPFEAARALLHRIRRAPSPYVASLVADGDHMGALIESALERNGVDAYRAISEALGDFAARARTIVEQAFRGVLVYAGGDDVLAFVTLTDALDCANALRLAFVAALEQRGLSGTLSVGVGIGHLLESMGDLLGLGRKAEKLAKRERNSLGIIFDKRSGGTLEWSAGWALEPLSLLTLPDGLSTKKLYQLKSDLGRMPAPDASRTTWAGVLRADTERTLDRSGDKALTPADARLVWPADPLDYPAHHAALTEWVARMLIARNLAEHTVATANGEGNP